MRGMPFLRVAAALSLIGAGRAVDLVPRGRPAPPPLRLSPEGNGRAIAAVLDPRTGRLLVASDRTVVVNDRPDGEKHVGIVSTVDIGTGTLAREVETPSLFNGVYTALDEARGRAFFVSIPDVDGGDSRMSTLDARSGSLVRTITLGPTPIVVVVAHAAGRVFIVDANGGGSGRVWMCDARDGALVRTIAVDPYPGGASVDETTGRVFVASGEQGRAYSVSTLDARSGRVIRKVVVGPRPSDASLAPDAGPLVVDEKGGRVAMFAGAARGPSDAVVLDARSGAPLHIVRLGPDPRGLAVDARRDRIFAERGGQGQNLSLDTLDARSGALLGAADVGSVAVGIETGQIALDVRRGRVFVGAVGRVTVLDAQGGRILRTIQTRDTPGIVRAMVVDEVTGRLFVYGTLGSRPGGAGVGVFDATTGRTISAASLPDLPPDVAAVDTRRARVVVLGGGPVARQASEPGRAYVLDARTGVLLRAAPVGSDPLAALIDPRSGRILVVDQGDDTVTEVDPGAGAASPPPQARPNRSPAARVVGRATAAPRIPVIIAMDAGAGRVFVGERTRARGGDQGSVDVLDARSGA